MDPDECPQLRPVEVKRLQQHGRWYFHLRDHLALAGREVLVPEELGPVLALFDGCHTVDQVLASAAGAGLALGPTALAEMVDYLHTSLLLEGDDVDRAIVEALAAYHSGPHRLPAFAGSVYPRTRDDLKAHLAAFDMAATADVAPVERVAGVLTPHIDYARGGSIYAQAWKQARDAARGAEQVILLGTDHCGGRGSLTLTRQRYATPFGIFDDDTPLRDAVAGALGEDAAYADELHHRTEHSAELAAVWLHHVRNGRPVRLTPILCGPPSQVLESQLDGSRGGAQRLIEALAVLRSAVAAGALVVVAGDLSHVGPAFGDPAACGTVEREQVRAADLALVAACSGGAGSMLAASAAERDRYRVCGLGPLGVALAIMPPVELALADYAQCSADALDASFVSIGAGCFLLRAAGAVTPV